MKGRLFLFVLLTVVLGLASTAVEAAPLSGAEPEWLRAGSGEMLSQDGICYWQCNDETYGSCYPPPEACWAESESFCASHGGVDYWTFDTLPV